MNVTGSCCVCHSSLCIVIRKQVTDYKTVTKVKTEVKNISSRYLHKFQGGLGRKKRIESFRIWF